MTGKQQPIRIPMTCVELGALSYISSTGPVLGRDHLGREGFDTIIAKQLLTRGTVQGDHAYYVVNDAGFAVLAAFKEEHEQHESALRKAGDAKEVRDFHDSHDPLRAAKPGRSAKDLNQEQVCTGVANAGTADIESMAIAALRVLEAFGKDGDEIERQESIADLREQMEILAFGEEP